MGPVRLEDSELRAEWMWARWEIRMAGVLASGPTESTVGTHKVEREGAIRELNKGDPVRPHENKVRSLAGRLRPGLQVPCGVLVSVSPWALLQQSHLNDDGSDVFRCQRKH